MTKLAAILLLLTGVVLAENMKLSKGVTSLVEAEKAFSALSEKEGIRSSFLAYMADDAVLFKPLPQPGKKFMSERSEVPGVLTWKPTVAAVSTSGDLGFTTGPWEYRKSEEDSVVGYGTFVTVWRMVEKLGWRVAADIGVSYERPTAPEASLIDMTIVSAPKKNEGVEKESAGLLELEKNFSKLCQDQGVDNAYRQYASDQIRMLRSDLPPIIGRDAVNTYLATTKSSERWNPEHAEVSRQADLGYTYGRLERNKGGAMKAVFEYSSFLHIWQRTPDGSWKMVVDVENPLPPQSVKPKE